MKPGVEDFDFIARRVREIKRPLGEALAEPSASIDAYRPQPGIQPVPDSIPLWQSLGLPEDPQCEIDIVFVSELTAEDFYDQWIC